MAEVLHMDFYGQNICVSMLCIDIVGVMHGHTMDIFFPEKQSNPNWGINGNTLGRSKQTTGKYSRDANPKRT